MTGETECEAIAPKFRRKQLVKHVKTGGVYRIIHTPATLRMEANNEPAYAYRAVWIVSSRGGTVDMTNAPIWARCQAEMEDGRFEPFVASADEIAAASRGEA